MNLFKKTSSHWVRYDKYEWKKDAKGKHLTGAERRLSRDDELAGESNSIVNQKKCLKNMQRNRDFPI